MRLLIEGGFTIIYCQPWPSDTDTIHRYHDFIQPVYSYSEDPAGEKIREHVSEVEYAVTSLSVRSSAFSITLLQYQNVMR